MKMQLHMLVLGFLGLVSAVSVPLFFINGTTIEKSLIKIYPLKVDERYTGGKVLVSLTDPFGDDHGEGELSYPLNEYWSNEGSLDLIRYVVHQPVTEGKWATQRVFWQLDFTFSALSDPLKSSGGFFHPIIKVYIDIDGQKGGSFETLESRAELARFSEAHPWDFCVTLHGNSEHGELVSYDRAYSAQVPVFLDKDSNSISIRLPLEKEGLLPVLDNRETHHFVLVGAYSQLGRGHFMGVKQGRASGMTAGGAMSRLTPKIFDCLTPPGISQEEMLSSYQEDLGLYAVMQPITIATSVSSMEPTDSSRQALIEELRIKAEEETTEEKPALTIDEIQSHQLTEVDTAVALFHAGYIVDAEQKIEQHLKDNPGNPVLLAYAASITALHGGEAVSVIKAVSLVNKAYELFEEAERLMVQPSDFLHLYLNRGNVSLNIPENVFQKSISGAKDFERAAALFHEMGVEKSGEASEALFKAGLCLDRAGKKVAAEVLYLKALAEPGLTDTLRYQLAQKGYFR